MGSLLMPRTWTATQFTDPAGGHASCIVALWLSPDQAIALAAAGGEPPDSLHITLLCIEDAADLSDIQIAHLLSTCDNIAAFTPPLAGEVTGMGRFYANDNNDGQDVIFAIPSLPEVVDLRERLEDELGWSRADVEISDDFGFLPHITLAYVAPGASSPVDAVATIPLRFDALTVCIGDRQTVIPLRGWSDGPMCYADPVRLSEGGLFFTEVKMTEPPEWLPLLPAPGDYLHPEWGTISMSSERIQRLVNSVDQGIYQSSIPVDAEHDLDVSGALGWFSKTRVNPDGSADVQVDWTERGKAMLADDRFRYVSPTFWFEWTDPASSTVHEDVITGLALCTRPFFKDLAIDRAALVASERGAATPSLSLVRHDGEPVRFVASERAAKPAPEVKKMTSPSPLAADDPNAIVDPNAANDGNAASPTLPSYDQWSALQVPGADMSLTAYATYLLKWAKQADSAGGAKAAVAATENNVTFAQQFSDVVKRLNASEGELDKMRKANQRKEFTDEVMGRSDANNIRWFGDVETHVGILESLPDGQRQKYIESQREQAKRLTAALGKERGSDAPGDADNSFRDKLDAKARKFAEEKGVTHAQAVQAVLASDKELRRQYVTSERNRTPSFDEE